MIEKYREIARENIKVFRISAETARGELKKEVERYEKLSEENERLKRENEELDEALEIAARDCDKYKEILAEYGLLSVAKEVVEVPDELPSGEGVGSEVTPHPSAELTPSPQGEGFSGEIVEAEPLVEVENEEVD